MTPHFQPAPHTRFIRVRWSSVDSVRAARTVSTIGTLVIILAGCTIFAATPASAAAPDAAASWEPMIVLTGNAQVFDGNKPGAKIPPGTIVYVAQRNPPWLLVPRYNQWLNEKHVRSLPAALKWLNEEIQNAPTADLLHYRAIVLSALGEHEAALRDFDEAILGGADAANVFLNRGLAWNRAGQPDRALDDFNEALRRDRKSAAAYYNRGVLHSEAGRSAAAMQDLDRAIELDPKFAEAYNNRGVLHQQQGQPELALADFDAALTIRARYPDALTNRAYLNQRQGAFAAALEDYAKAVRIAPDLHATLNDLAWLLATAPDANLRNGASALQFAQRANDLTGHANVDYLDTLAAAAAEAGDFTLAVATARKALELSSPEDRDELEARLKLYEAQQPYREAAPEPAPTPESPPAGEAPPATDDSSTPDAAEPIA